MPSDWSVESGNAQVETPDANTLNFTVADKTVINFGSFNIAQNETVNFFQPSATASVLSRVTGPQMSEIAGTLTANGMLFLVNPNGIHFAPTANIQVNALVASSLNLAVASNNFMNGEYVFARGGADPYARVLNEGRITGNNIALIGNSVHNDGIIQAVAGVVHMAGGDKITVSFDARQLLQVEINEATSGQVVDAAGNTVKDAVANKGTIEANQVFLTAKTAGDIFENAANQEGVVKATRWEEVDGVIRIVADKKVKVSGTMEAQGGTVEVASQESVEVPEPLQTAGKTTIKADGDITVKADVTTVSGDLALLADYDLDGKGAFNQAQGTTISTVDFGNITIQASGASTLANINSAGDLILQQGGAPVAFDQWAGSTIVTKGSTIINPGVTLNASNTVYEVGQNWVNLGNFNPQFSTVRLVSGLMAYVMGSNTFFDFMITEPGKIVKFDAEETQTIVGTLTLKGSYGDLLVLDSAEPLLQWKILPQGETHIMYTLIGNSVNIRGPPLQGEHSDSLGNNLNWTLHTAWSGQGFSAVWSDPDNWDTGTVPLPTSDVVFDGLTGLNPNKDSVLDPAFSGALNSLVLDGYTGTLTMARNLTLNGDLTMKTGNFSVKGSGTMVPDPFSLTSLHGDIRLNAASGDITLPARILAQEGSVYVNAPKGVIHSYGTILANLDHGVIVFKAEELRLGGTYKASFIDLDPANIWIDAAINTTGAVTFTATNDIYVNANVFTTSGDITFNADSDGNDSGSFIQAAGTEIKTTTSGDITITGASAMVYKLTSAGAVNIYKSLGVGMAGDITIADIIAGVGNVKIDSNNNINLQSNISSSGGDLEISADYDNDGTGNLTLANGITLTAGASSGHQIQSANALSISGTTLTVGGNSATLSGGALLALFSTGSSGTITVTGAVTETSGVFLVSNDGGINLQANVLSGASLQIYADPEDDGTGNLTITNGITLTAGASSAHGIRAANALSISGTTLTVGGNSATLSGGNEISLHSTGSSGTITVTGAVTETNGVYLYSNDGGIDLQANVSSSGSSLQIHADNDDDGTGNLTITNGITLTAGASSAHNIKAANALSISGTTLTVGANSATLSGGNTLYLTSTGSSGNITVTGAVTETNSVFLYSYDGGIDLQAGVSSSAGGLWIYADNDNDGTGNLTITNGITLTAGASAAHDIKAANALSVSGTTLTVGGNAATLSGGASLILISTGSSGTITVTGAVTETIFVYLYSYDGGINLQGNVSAEIIQIHTDFDEDGTGNLTITNGITLTAGSAWHSIKAANALSISGTTLTVGGNSATLSGGTGLVLISTGAGGTITVTGAVTETDTVTLDSYDGGIDLRAGVSAGVDISIDADFDNDGTGNLTITNGITLTAGSGYTHDIKAANALSISGTSLIVGGNSATLSGGATLLLISTGSSGTITVTGAVTETNGVYLYSYDGGIDLQAGISPGSDLLISADNDEDGTGNLTITNGITLTAGSNYAHSIIAANALSISGTTLTVGGNSATLSGGNALYLASTGSSGTITVTGAVTETNGVYLYSYHEGIDLQAGVSSGGDIYILAGLDGDGTGDLTQSAGTISTTGANDVFLWGNNVSLSSISANSGSSNIYVTAIGNITSNSANLTAANVVLTTITGNIGTSGTPIPIGSGVFVDASAPEGSVYITRSSGDVTIKNASEASNVQDFGVAITTASYGGQTQYVGDNITHNTTDGFDLTTPGNFVIDSGVTFNADNSTINLNNSSASDKTFDGGDRTYNIVNFANTGAGIYIVTGANTADYQFEPNSKVQFPSGVTQTVTGFSGNGTSGNPVTITSSTPGSPFTLSKSSGTVSLDYFSIQDSTVTGGARWYAGANSTPVSGNSGWIFTAVPLGTVYYSVGQTAANLMTGTPNVSITGGVATFTSAAQTGNIGVGDKITVGGNVYYIASKTSTTVWSVVDEHGAAPADLGSTAVTSITRAYTSLFDAEAGASDASHLNDTDLVTGNYILNFSCYYDTGADTTPVTIDGWTTGAANYIKIYTPNNTATEANQSQRHAGVWDAGKYRLDCSIAAGEKVFSTVENYTRIDGLQIKATPSDQDTAFVYSAFYSESIGNIVSDNLIKGDFTSWSAGNTGAMGIFSGTDLEGSNYYYNNIVYGFDYATHANGIGVFVENHASGKSYFYNNTVVDCGLCVKDGYNDIVAINVLVKPVSGGVGFSADFDSNSDYNASSDATAPGTNSRQSQTFTFVDEAGKDFHLALTDLGARGYGLSQYADANLPVTTDIDGNARRLNGEVADIGADEDIDILDGESVRISPIKESGARYSTLASWEADRNGDITGYYPEVAQIDGAWTNPDTTAVTIDGWTTDATHYIKIYTTAAARHSGVWDDGKYRLAVDLGGSNAGAIDLREDYLKIDGLQITITGSGQPACIYGNSFSATTNLIEVSNNILKATSGFTGSVYALLSYDADANWKIWNNIAYDFRLAGDAEPPYPGAMAFRYSNTAYVYNNTFYNNRTSIVIHPTDGGAVVAKNNLFSNNYYDLSGLVFANGTDYNATDGASLGYTVTGGGNTHDRVGQTFTFVDAANDDFHLALTDLGARGYGLSQYSDANCPVTTDIDGNYRRPNGEVTDIGADEDIDILDGESVRISPIKESGARYSTLFAWEADRDGDITGYYPEVAQIDGAWASPDTTAVTIDGWTTNATHYIKIYTTPTARHSGVWDIGKYRLEASDNGISFMNQAFVRVEGLQILVYDASAGISSNYSNHDGILIAENIIKGNGSSANPQAGIYLDISGGNEVYIWNNIIYDIGQNALSTGIVIYNGYAYIYNNTVINSYYGIYGEAVNIFAKNNLVQSATNGYFGSFDASSDYNISNQTSDAPSPSYRNNLATTVTFVDASNKDFHLALTDLGARGYGLSQYADANCPVTTDIDGHYRRPNGEVTDIGADEDIDILDGESVRISPIKESGARYSTLSAWEADRDGDITGYYPEIAQIDGAWTNPDTTAVTIDGWTTDTTHYIKIYTTAAARHGGVWDEGKYRLAVGHSTGLTVREDFVRIDGIQVSVNLNYVSTLFGVLLTGSTAGADLRLSNSIIKEASDSYAHGGVRYDYLVGNVSRTAKIWNNLIYDFHGSSGYGLSLNDNDWTIYFYNNTIQNCTYGINSYNVIAKNNIVKGSGDTNAYVGTFASGTDYNATDGTDNIGQGSNNRISQTFSFVDEANDDFHLALTDLGARGYGLSQYSDANCPVTTDIDGNFRRPNGEVTDIGADEDIDILDGESVRISPIKEAGARYSTLSSWEADRDGNITGYYPEVAQIDGAWTNPDTTAVTIGGWTTDASHYIKIYTTPTARHDGKWNNGKYRMTWIDVLEEYVRVDGVQFTDALSGDSCLIYIDTTMTSDVRISNNILKPISLSGEYTRGIRLDEGVFKVFNNIIYDFNGTNNYAINTRGNGGVGYIYNNTIVNCTNGITNENSANDTLYVKNNIVQGATDSGYYSGGNDWGSGSDYNISDQTSDAPSPSYRSGLATTVSFVDEANDDFHLALTDLGARGYGLSQYADANCPVTADIDGNYRRPNGKVTDIGADEDIDILDGESVRISPIKESGARYSTLSAWESDRDGDITGYYPEVAQIDGAWTNPDTTAVTINGWTTDATHYIKVYTTTAARHQGVWDTGKYRLELSNPLNGQSVILNNENNVRISGLQMYVGDPGTGWADTIFHRDIVGSGEVWTSDNILKSNGATNDGAAIATYVASGVDFMIYNNIIYDFQGNNPYAMYLNAGGGNQYVYNNTVYNCNHGITSLSGNVIAKNNISYNNTDNYVGAFDAASTNNLSGPTQTDAPGSNPRNAQTVAFVDAANKDFHLATNDLGARGYGLSQYSDPNCPVTTDIDGNYRRLQGEVTDIGADEDIDMLDGDNVRISPIKESGARYSTLASWEADRDGDITGYYPEIAQIDGAWTNPDTTAVEIDGWTTDATHYIKVYTTTAARHQGVWDDGKYRLEITGAVARPLAIHEDYVRVDGLEIGAAGNDGGFDVHGISIGDSNTGTQLSNLIIRNSSTGTAAIHGGIFQTNIGYPSVALAIWDTIIYGFQDAGIYLTGSPNMVVYNTTVYNCGVGFLNFMEASNAVLKNNISYNNTDNYAGTFNAASTNNLSGSAQADAPGSNPRNAQTVTFVSTTPGSEDFHLALTDLGARGYGLSQYSDANCPVTTDIDGNARRPNGEVTDIGADEDIDILDGESVRISPIKESGARYSTLASWESDRDGDITGYYPEVAQIDGAWTNPDTTAVTIDGWTTDATHYIKIYTTSAARHQGVWDEGKYRMEVSNNHVITVNEDYVRLDGLQLKITAASNNSNNALYVNTVTPGSNEVRISNSIACGVLTGTSNSNRGFRANADSNTLLWNNIFYDWGLSSPSSNNAIYLLGSSAYLYNNTLHGNDDGIRADAGTVVAINNLVTNTGNANNAYLGTFATGTDYNATDGTDDIGQGTHNRISQTFTFVDEANDDFHLATTDLGARGYGLSQYADANCPVTTDIDGNYRRPNGEVTDIGADEDIDLLDGENVRISPIKESGARYSTLASWEADRDGDITGYYPEVAQIDGAWTNPDTTAVTIDGWTTDATHYIKIYTTTAARHQGVWDSSKYSLVYTTTTGANGLKMSEEYVKVDGLQLEANASTTIVYGILRQDCAGVVNHEYSNNLIKSPNSSATVYAINMPTGSGSVKVWNNIIYDTYAGIRKNSGYTGMIYAYNNTVYGSVYGYLNGLNGASFLLKNNIAYNNTDNYSPFDVFNAASTNNLSGNNQGDAPGSNPRNLGVGETITFVDEAGKDFHLATTDLGARGYGLSQYADANCPVTTDIDGNARRPNGEVTDIGADEDIDTLDGESVRISPIKESGARYATLFDWEADRDGDITGYYPEVAQIDGAWTNPDTTAVTIDGWTTDASHYIKIYTTAAARHSGVWDAGKYRLDITAAYNYHCVLLSMEGWVHIDGLQIGGTFADRTGGYGIRLIPPDTMAVYISNNIIRGVISGTSTAQIGIRAEYDASAGTRVVKGWNNIVYGFVEGIHTQHTGWTTSYWYNNTVFGCSGNGFWTSGASILNNNISYNNTDNYSGTFHASSTNNLSGPSQTDAPGSNPRNAQTVAFVSTTPGSEDFHLALTDLGARGYGLSQYTDPNCPVTTDIDGNARRSNGEVTDIGADEDIDVLDGESVRISPIKESGARYSTLSSWESDRDGNITGYYPEVAQIDGAWTNPDTTPVTIGGWTTDATHYIKIYTTAAARHQGKWDTNAYRIVDNTGGSNFSVTIYDDHVKVDGLQIQRNATGPTYDGTMSITSIGSGGVIDVSNTIFRSYGTSTATSELIGVEMYSLASTVEINLWNNIFYDFNTGSASNRHAIWSLDSDGVINIYNTTIFNATNGIRVVAGVVTAKNVITQGCANGFNGSFTSNSDYNISDLANDAPSPSYRSNLATTVTFVSTTPGSEDFHLALTDLGARGYGLSQYSDANCPVTTDVDGNARRPNGEVTDIGADEDIDILDGESVRISPIQESGARYSTLASWEADRNGDITGYYPEVAQIDGAWTAPDTTAVTIDGWTTDATHYIKIYTTVAARHQGVWDEGKYNLLITNDGSVTQYALGYDAKYLRIEGLQIKYVFTNSVIYPTVIQDMVNDVNSDIRISNNIITADFAASTSGWYGFGLRHWWGSYSVKKVWNNIFYGISTPNGDPSFVMSFDTGELYAYNNTLADCDYGFNANGGGGSPVFMLMNNIVQNCMGGFQFYSAGSDYNISDLPNDAPSPSYRNNLATTVTFVDAANNDFHLAVTDTGAKGAGVNLYADPNCPVTTDIDGRARPSSGAFDIGADEIIAATWTGASSNFWNVAGNWSGAGGVPMAGDELVFPGGAANLSNSNDFTAGTSFGSITFTGSDYTLAGNSITLGAGGITDSAAAGSNEISLDMSLGTDRTITVTNAAETLTMSGVISGAGGLTKDGAGTLALSNTVTLGSDLTISAGTLSIDGATLNIGGNWLNSGVFTAGTSTVNFNGAASANQITTGGNSHFFNNISFTGAGGEWTLQDDMKVTGQFEVTDGVFISGANTVTLQGASATYQGANVDAGNTDWTGGTLILLSDADQTLPDGETYNNLQLGRDAGTGITTYDMGSVEYFIDGTGVIDADAKVVLTVNATGVNKVYDCNAIAIATFSHNSKFLDYLDLTYAYTAVFSSGKNAGLGKTIDVTGISLGSTDAGSYALSSTTDTATADITPRSLTVTAVTDTKVCDGNTSSDEVPTITLGALQGGDSVTWAQVFDTADPGTGKILTSAGVVTDGNSGNNYSYTFVNDTTGVITAPAQPPATTTPVIPETVLNQLNINPFTNVGTGTGAGTPGMGTTGTGTTGTGSTGTGSAGTGITIISGESGSGTGTGTGTSTGTGTGTGTGNTASGAAAGTSSGNEKNNPEGEGWRNNLNFFFSPDTALNLRTNVRVLEGAVSVMDNANGVSLLGRGDLARVFYKDLNTAKETRLCKGSADPGPCTDASGRVRRPKKTETPAVKALVEPEAMPPDMDQRVRKAASPIVTDQTKEGLRYGTLKNPGKDVFVRSRNGEWMPAKDGMVILPGDEVKTAQKNSVEVLLDGGQVGHVEIKGGSLFRISKAEVDPVTGDKITLLDLAIGKILVDVEKLKGHSKFEVRTPTAQTSVRGTTFEVSVDEKSEKPSSLSQEQLPGLNSTYENETTELESAPLSEEEENTKT